MSCGKKCNCPTKREHWLSIGVSYKAMPTRHASVITTEAKEKEITRERDAYKRLKDDGLQPARLMGASNIEREARSELEVRTGTKFKSQTMANEAEAIVKESLKVNAIR